MTLDTPTTFTGAIAPAAGGNAVTLSNVDLTTITSYSYSGDKTGGTLSLHEAGGGSLDLKFIGSYTTASFALAAASVPLSSSPPAITIREVDVAPTVVVPTAPYVTNGYQILSLKNAGILVGDADGGSQIDRLTLSTNAAQVFFFATAGGSGVTVSASGIGAVMVTGTIAQISAWLNSDATSTIGVGIFSKSSKPIASLSVTLEDSSPYGTETATGTGTLVSTVPSPVVTIANPGASVLNAAQTVSGSATTPGANAFYTAGSVVTLADNGTTVGTATVDQNGQWSTAITLAAVGTNTLVATVADTFGVSATSAPVVLTYQQPTTIEKEVDLLYHAILGRLADPQGLAYYAAQVDAGGTLEAQAASMLNSAELQANYGLLDDAHKLILLFENGYGINPLQQNGGFVTFNVDSQDLSTGTPLAEIATAVALSATNQSLSGVAPLGGVINPTVTGSIEHDPTSAAGQVFLLNETLFGHAPTALDLETETAMLTAGAPPSQLAANLLTSSVYQSQYGAQDDQQFVEQLYANSFGRPADAAGLAHYQGQLAAGTSRADVATDIALSPEHVTDDLATFATGIFVTDRIGSDVARLYHGIFGRAPDLLGLENYEGAAAGRTSLAQIATSMITSAEYEYNFGVESNVTFVDHIYQDALGRAAEAAGLQYYAGLLSQGLSRGQVATFITESQEAKLHLAPVIENSFQLS